MQPVQNAEQMSSQNQTFHCTRCDMPKRVMSWRFPSAKQQMQISKLRNAHSSLDHYRSVLECYVACPNEVVRTSTNYYIENFLPRMYEFLHYAYYEGMLSCQ